MDQQTCYQSDPILSKHSHHNSADNTRRNHQILHSPQDQTNENLTGVDLMTEQSFRSHQQLFHDLNTEDERLMDDHCRKDRPEIRTVILQNVSL